MKTVSPPSPTQKAQQLHMHPRYDGRTEAESVTSESGAEERKDKRCWVQIRKQMLTPTLQQVPPIVREHPLSIARNNFLGPSPAAIIVNAHETTRNISIRTIADKSIKQHAIFATNWHRHEIECHVSFPVDQGKALVNLFLLNSEGVRRERRRTRRVGHRKKEKSGLCVINKEAANGVQHLPHPRF